MRKTLSTVTSVSQEVGGPGKVEADVAQEHQQSLDVVGFVQVEGVPHAGELEVVHPERLHHGLEIIVGRIHLGKVDLLSGDDHTQAGAAGRAVSCIGRAHRVLAMLDEAHGGRGKASDQLADVLGVDLVDHMACVSRGGGFGAVCMQLFPVALRSGGWGLVLLALARPGSG